MVTRVMIILSCLSTLLFSSYSVVPMTGDKIEGNFKIHIVKKSESISLLCIDYYGHYSEAFGDALLKINPEIKDINLIFEGQKLQFPLTRDDKRKPGPRSRIDTLKTPASATPVPSDSDTLFVRKSDVTQGVVTCAVGTVKLYKSGIGAGQPLAVNTIVFPGDVIATGPDGRVELIINRESVVRLRERTRMTLEAFRLTDGSKDKTRVGFSIGGIWTKVKKFKDKLSRFELEMPNAVAGVHGTVYQSDIKPDSSSEVKVFSGEVAVQGARSKKTGGAGGQVSEVSGPGEVEGPHEVDMETWTKIVQSMQKLTIAKNGSPSEPVSFTKNNLTEWEKWNEERDRRIAEMFKEAPQ